MAATRRSRSTSQSEGSSLTSAKVRDDTAPGIDLRLQLCAACVPLHSTACMPAKPTTDCHSSYAMNHLSNIC